MHIFHIQPQLNIFADKQKNTNSFGKYFGKPAEI